MKITVELLDTPLSTAVCQPALANEGAGGIVWFVGTVRNQTEGRTVRRLEFEAYTPMALAELRKIGEQACARWPVQKMVIHHRIGTLAIGDIAVIIGVACPHRAEAFAACQFAIDTLKQTVPIWKKEFFDDGAVWVAAHP
ncbi:MAG: molybdenum cofactor biosynthesis protein MoaE [Bacteroidetes bacterium]|nr:MAG: molybdenum cofactor biosynthesis protein MoaE [Bacteroidota bacterium]PTM10916.1 MAG: molybdenum cofactor biosynthesis protein MoaE [Bacteroidota bacterium]